MSVHWSFFTVNPITGDRERKPSPGGTELTKLMQHRSRGLRPEHPNVHIQISNPIFKKACEIAKVDPSRRQLSRFRNRQGAAYSMRHVAEANLKAQAREAARPKKAV